MVARSGQNKEIEVNIAGSSTFGRYPKISRESTFNMFVSDSWLVDYAGYDVIINSKNFANGKSGRGIFKSTKLVFISPTTHLETLVVVIDDQVWLVRLIIDEVTLKPIFQQIINIGALQTSVGVVYITENNKPQILISDNVHLYIYDPTVSGMILVVPFLDFTPGYVTFHDTYFIAAASNDTSRSAAVNNTWRLSFPNQGYVNPTDSTKTAWPSAAPRDYVGLIQSKPDNTQAVVRFPSQGNMIAVMGSIVTEFWYDTGAQLFPYQRNNQMNIDYGCLSPATVAYMDEILVWLAQNEKSGPIIMYTNGKAFKKITTDGIDFLFGQLQNPRDSQGFLYRQDGHMFYHINFYTDNLSFFYDFNTDKFYQASDQNLNYFIAANVAFMGDSYYFVSKNTGNLYLFDTKITTYNDYLSNKVQTVMRFEIPRIRICKNIRLPTQNYFIANDVGFTIESGETDYYQQNATGPDQFLLLNGQNFFLLNGQQFNLLSEDEALINTTPTVFLSVSYDGGAVFGSEWAYELPAIGYRRNRLMWWQLGAANDLVTKFRFQSIGRFVATEGICNIRV